MCIRDRDEEALKPYGEGQIVIVGGSSLGLEVAEFLVEKLPEAKIKILEEKDVYKRQIQHFCRCVVFLFDF